MNEHGFVTASTMAHRSAQSSTFDNMIQQARPFSNTILFSPLPIVVTPVILSN